MNIEKGHWNAVFKRLLSVVQFPYQRNFPFHGSNAQIYNSKNGNFMKLVKLI